MTIITTQAAEATYRRDLGDGLVLRWSTAADTENIAQLVSLVFRDKEDEPPNEPMSNEIRQLMRGDHPLMGPGDFGVVEDTRKEGNPIVACTCLWRNHWEYEGIPFAMGQPEIVATNPEYRNRGLIRALFDMVHARSESEGHMVQAITGIPYFYRQFGYEYALNLEGKRVTYVTLIPKAKEGEPEPYTLRNATAEDIPLIQECYNRRRATSVVWTNIPDTCWLYEIQRRDDPRINKMPRLQMIINITNTVRGYTWLSARRRGNGSNFNVYALDVLPSVNLHAMMPSVLRGIQAYAATVPTHGSDAAPVDEISFNLGRTHPVYEALGNVLAPFYEAPYAWYVRVRSIPAFLRYIAPALEKRLENSVVESYTGELKIDMYRGGIHMVFEHGRLTAAEPWQLPIYNSNAGAGCPQLVFLQLLFGHRSLDELRYAFPDVWADRDAEILLKTLFPAKPSATLSL